MQIRMDESSGARIAADYRSANGVTINGTRIVADVPLQDGDRILIGDTMMVYLVADHPDAASAAEAVRKKSEWKRTTQLRRDG